MQSLGSKNTDSVGEISLLVALIGTFRITFELDLRAVRENQKRCLKWGGESKQDGE